MDTIIPAWTKQDRLRKAREIAGLNHAEMASALGVSEKTAWNYEHGKSPMKRAMLVAWALRCGVPVEWIEDGEDGDNSGATARASIRELSPLADTGLSHLLTAPVLPYAS
jgi:transcriptional regulator with XRE-family HTH domain